MSTIFGEKHFIDPEMLAKLKSEGFDAVYTDYKKYIEENRK